MIFKIDQADIVDSGASGRGSYISLSGEKYNLNLGDILEIDGKLQLIADIIYGYYSNKIRNLKNPQTYEVVLVKRPQKCDFEKSGGNVYLEFSINTPISVDELVYSFGQVWQVTKHIPSTKNLMNRVLVKPYKAR